MTEINLFKLLQVDLNDEEGKQKIDADAIIKKAQQNPCDINLMYTFSYSPHSTTAGILSTRPLHWVWELK
eukprot:11576270-Ditylum_brightwellii.AAC.1